MNEILLYGSIGPNFWDPEDAVTAKNVIDQLASIDGDVTVRISSGGGSVYEGIDIMNALKEHPGKVTVIVESLAASAASFIAVGGADEVLMRESSEMMIHRASHWAEGDASDVQKLLDDLIRQDTKLANIYKAKAGGGVDDWLAAMDKETWYTAQEAVAAGLADGIVGAEAPEPAVASGKPYFVASMKRFKYAGRAAAPPPAIKNNAPIGEKKEKPVSFLNDLAQELGADPDELRKKLVGIKNEIVPISGEVEVNYPTETLIVPTEKVTIEPIIGADASSEDGTVQNAAGDSSSLGLTFEVGTAPEGWTVTVDESTGTATVTAPSGAEVGAVVEATVKANGTTDIPLTLKVRSLSEPDAPEEVAPVPGAPTASVSSMGIPEGMSLVPTAHFEKVSAGYQKVAEQQAQAERKSAEARVNKDIGEEGRFHVQMRDQAIAMLLKDPQGYEKTWGNLPKNTFPVTELGHSNTADVNDPNDEDFSPSQLAKQRREAKNGVKK